MYSMSSVRGDTLYFHLTECKKHDLGTVARLGRPLVLNIAWRSVSHPAIFRALLYPYSTMFPAYLADPDFQAPPPCCWPGCSYRCWRWTAP